MDRDFEDLHTEILRSRWVGRLHIDRRPRVDVPHSPDLRKIADLYVRALGFDPPNQDWMEITRQEATTILTRILHKDLAYDGDIMLAARAEELAGRFVGAFGSGCHYLTTAEFDESFIKLKAWCSLTEATFDTGVVIISAEYTGLVWVEDED